MTRFHNSEGQVSLRCRFIGIASLLLILIASVGCAKVRDPQGWSGGSVVGDVLYIGTSEGELVALDRNSGEGLWRFELRGEEEADRAIYGTPAVADNNVFVGGYDGILYAVALDDSGGLKELKWRKRVGGSIVGSPVVDSDLVFVGSSDGNMYAFDVVEGTEEWRFTTSGKVWSTPVVENGVVYFGSIDGNVYAVGLEDGQEIWRFRAKGAVAASPLLDRDRLYVGSFGSVFYAINARTGLPVWQFDQADNWFWGRAVVADKVVYAPSLDGNLYALSKETGDLRWVVRTEGAISSSPVIVHDMVAVASDDGKVRLVRSRDGLELDFCDIREKIRSSLVESNGFIYFGAQDGSIRALRIKSNGNPDDVWVRFTEKGVPESENRVLAC